MVNPRVRRTSPFDCAWTCGAGSAQASVGFNDPGSTPAGRLETRRIAWKTLSRP